MQTIVHIRKVSIIYVLSSLPTHLIALFKIPNIIAKRIISHETWENVSLGLSSIVLYETLVCQWTSQVLLSTTNWIAYAIGDDWVYKEEDKGVWTMLSIKYSIFSWALSDMKISASCFVILFSHPMYVLSLFLNIGRISTILFMLVRDTMGLEFGLTLLYTCRPHVFYMVASI